MPIGFVPCNDNDAESPELSEARERWLACRPPRPGSSMRA